MPEPGRRRAYLVGAGAAGLLVAALVGLRFGVEWVEREIDLGYGEAAQQNPYLAAHRFLAARGVESETAPGLGFLDGLGARPAPDTLLVLSGSRRTLSARRVAALADWVDAGGHLFVVATELWDEEAEASRDPLLDGFGVRLWALDDLESDEDAAVDEDGDQGGDEGGDQGGDEGGGADDGADDGARGRKGEGASPSADADEDDDGTGPRAVRVGELLDGLEGEPACVEDESTLARVRYAESGHWLRVAIDEPRHLQSVNDVNFAIAADAGAQVIQKPIGDGLLTVATSLRPWQNRWVACHDHAFVLWLLAPAEGGRVYWLHDVEAPGLAEWLVTSFPLGSFAALLGLVAWAASRSLSFGLRPPPVERERRGLLEHLEAASALRWRADRLASELASIGPPSAARASREAPSRSGAEAPPRSRAALVRRVRRLQRSMQQATGERGKGR